MNLGNELVSHILRTQEIKPFLEADLNLDWLSSKTDHSNDAIFDEEDEPAYRWILQWFQQHRKVPSEDAFRSTFPKDTYRLSREEYENSELLALAEQEIQRYVVEATSAQIKDLYEAGDFTGAGEAMEEAAKRIRGARTTRSIVQKWDDPDIDMEAKLTRKPERGIRTGIDDLDKTFPGFPKGSLITYLGGAKAGKTSFLLLSALDSWSRSDLDRPLRVLLLTVEMSAEEITDKLDGMEAQIPVTLYQQGKLKKDDKDELRKLQKDRELLGPPKFTIIETSGKYTISDLEDDIEKHEPDVVYIDGFYFLIDRHTGKPGANWEGHDNLSRELKEVAMGRGITVVTTMQVREKQLKQGTMDDNAMMGGTGLIMASHMVFGFMADKETKLHTISNTRSRTGYLDTFKGKWDWDKAEFIIDYSTDEEDDFATGNY